MIEYLYDIANYIHSTQVDRNTYPHLNGGQVTVALCVFSKSNKFQLTATRLLTLLCYLVQPHRLFT